MKINGNQETRTGLLTITSWRSEGFTFPGGILFEQRSYTVSVRI